MRKTQRAKISLSLGGGGAKTFAHLGVLDALIKHGIEVDQLTTCSAASVLGLLYSLGYSCEEIKREFKRKRKWLYLFKLSIFKWVLKKLVLKKNLKDIKDLKIPMSIVTVDLKKGKEIVFEEGDPIWIPLASSAFPGIWKPVNYQGLTLIDGGVLNPDPANIARKKIGNDGVVISVTLKLELEEREIKSRLETLLKSIYLMSLYNRKKNMEENSDIIIAPSSNLKISLRGWKETFLGYFSNERIERYYQKGFEETEKRIAEIKKVIEDKNAKIN